MTSEDRLAPAYRSIERFKADGVKGAGLVVAKGGEIVGEYYAGMANTDREADAETIWPLASISKLYTAAAAMSLIEQGEIALSTKASSIFPSFTKAGRGQITLRHLLTHTSGLPYESDHMAERLAAKISLEAMVGEAYDCPMLFAPGKDQSYSDYGIGLAGLMCAEVAGISFPELVRTRVLVPGGLHNTFMPPPDDVTERIAYVDGALAEHTDGAMYNSLHARGLAHPAFGTIASARDLLRFGLLFDLNCPHRLFSRVGTTVMTTDQTGYDFPDHVTEPMSPSVQAWGLGFQVKGSMTFPELVSPSAFGHPGASGCIVCVDPKWDVAFSFVSNRHLNLGYDTWTDRLMQITNVVMSCMTND